MIRQRLLRAFAVVVLGLGTLSLAACAGEPGPALHSVSGKVLFENQPAEGATVVFEPIEATTSEGALRPSGIVGKDGKFTLQTHPHGAGAPAGEYFVLVTWLEAARAKEGEAVDSKNKLPAKYASGMTSGLTATVKPGDNTLEPFKLTKKGP